MTKPKLIEKLEDLATYFTLTASDAGREEKKAIEVDTYNPDIGFWEGKQEAYNTAFKKVDALIMEAKR